MGLEDRRDDILRKLAEKYDKEDLKDRSIARGALRGAAAMGATIGGYGLYLKSKGRLGKRPGEALGRGVLRASLTGGAVGGVARAARNTERPPKEKKAEILKEAGWLGDRFRGIAKKLIKDPQKREAFGDALKNALLFTGTGAAVGLAGEGVSSALGAAKAPISKGVGYRRMMKENPWLEEQDDKTVKKFYSTLHRFNPEMAKDPLVAGSYMKQRLQFRDVGIQPTDVASLVDVQKKLQDIKRSRGSSALRNAFTVSPAGVTDITGGPIKQRRNNQGRPGPGGGQGGQP
jgi:hypothetical protein